ncbi:ankyrin repeat-containing domain protein [Vararia minispora EC-137]|uniref:Ankyrin repeat-containing domain protein n=1 Tax=Vararia minispora EC-137 TaxID=1314806 RepID=A0ACB8QL68_9AGAM|nr:ankyrin repeat-containing domain protein [Vararia minispora EC-137]
MARSSNLELNACMRVVDASFSLDPASRLFELALLAAIREDSIMYTRSLYAKVGSLDFVLSSGCTPLRLAAEHESIRCVRLLLTMGADVRTVARHGGLVFPCHRQVGCDHVDVMLELIAHGASCSYDDLVHACTSGSLKLVHALVDQGLDVSSSKGHHSRSALHAVLSTKHHEIATFLLQCGANCTYRDLLAAASAGMFAHVQAIVAAGIDVNDFGTLGTMSVVMGGMPVNNAFAYGRESALYKALSHGHADVSTFLIQCGALCSYEDLRCAAEYGFLHIVQAIIANGVRVNEPDSWYNDGTPLGKAIRGGHMDVAGFLVQAGAVYSYGDLVYAVRSGMLDFIQLVASGGIDVNAPQECWVSALHAALTSGHSDVAAFLVHRGAICSYSDLVAAAQTGLLDTVKLIVNAGVSVDKPPEHTGISALTAALENGHADVAVFLMQHGRPRSYADLVSAARCGLLDTVRAIVAEGIGIGSPMERLESALHLSLSHGQVRVAEFLLEQGAKCTCKDLVAASQSGLLELVQALIARGVDPTPAHANGEKSALYAAVHAGHTDVVSFLVNHGVTFSSHDLLEASSFSGNLGMAQTIIACGIDVDATGCYDTPLRTALDWGRLNIAIFLIRRGANGRAYGSRGRDVRGTALQIAARAGYANVIEELLACGAGAYIDLDEREGLTVVGYMPPLQLALDNRHDSAARLLLKAVLSSMLDVVKKRRQTP